MLICTAKQKAELEASKQDTVNLQDRFQPPDIEYCLLDIEAKCVKSSVLLDIGRIALGVKTLGEKQSHNG